MYKSIENTIALGLVAATVAFAGWQGHRVALRENHSKSAATFVDGQFQRQYEASFAAALPTQGWAVEGYAALRLALFGEVAEGAILGQDGWLFTAEEMISPDQAEALRPALRDTMAILEPMGVQLIPVILPDKARLHRDRLPHSRSNRLQARFDAAQAVLRSEGLPVIDTVAAMEAHGFLRSDTHWHPEAARTVAQAIAAMLPPGGADFVTEVTGERMFYGDLSAFAQTGRFQRWTGIAPELVPTYATNIALNDGLAGVASAASALDLFAETQIPVALVGTSYSAKPAFHFEGFLKAALGRDVLNMARVGQGPFQPMRDYLASADFLDTPPDIVIWEIPERYLSLKGE